MSFFNDILAVYPDNRVELPDVQELETDSLQIIDVILKILKNVEFHS